MIRLRKLMPLLLVVALTLIAAVPVLAQLPPAVYRCSVYENGALVGVGKTVEAFVGTEATARDTATTDANGLAIIQFGVFEADLGHALTFKVNGYGATETPDVNVSIAGPDVRLDYTTGTTYTLDVTVSPTGKGTVSKSPNMAQYPAGTTVTLTANAISGWDFDYWSGAASGTNPTTMVTMNSNKSVTAYFEEEGAPAATFKSWLYDKFVECID